MPSLYMQILGVFRSVYVGTLVTNFIKARLQTQLAYLLVHRATYLSPQQLTFLHLPDSLDIQAQTSLRQLIQSLYQHSLRQTNKEVMQLNERNPKMRGRAVHVPSFSVTFLCSWHHSLRV